MLADEWLVSIHALTRSATESAGQEPKRRTVSIHALTRSATFVSHVEGREVEGFNPRTHEECDLWLIRSYQRRVSFNPRTHEECDKVKEGFVRRLILFQSTHSRGVRLTMSRSAAVFEAFQSTHSRGVRPLNARFTSAQKCFNPRTHEECDYARLVRTQQITVSIHALTRSATKVPKTERVAHHSFNPRTHEECDSFLRISVHGRTVSIHALTRSATAHHWKRK